MVDYCGAIHEKLLTCWLKCLESVLRTAARLVGRISGFDRVSGYMQNILHWLPYSQRIVYHVSSLAQCCVARLVTSTTLSPGTLLLQCYYSASYFIKIFCPSGVTGLPYADCYPIAPGLLCGWSYDR